MAGNPHPKKPCFPVISFESKGWTAECGCGEMKKRTKLESRDAAWLEYNKAHGWQRGIEEALEQGRKNRAAPWKYGAPEARGDCRKIVTLVEGEMTWVGIRAYNHSNGEWLNGGEPEKARVSAWMDLPVPDGCEDRMHW